MKARARSQGLSLNDFLLELMRKEMALPAMADWLDSVGANRPRVRDFAMTELIDEVRGEFDDKS